ncbi:MAG: hypothetical protein RLZZ345_703 [Actinomycetota bacterium]|jgi:hypothetical protein
MIFRGIFGLVGILVLRILLEAFNFSQSAGKDKLGGKNREFSATHKLVLIYAGLFLFAWIYFLPGLPQPALSFWMDTNDLSVEGLENAKLQAQTALILVALPFAFDIVAIAVATAFKDWNKAVIGLAIVVDAIGFLGFWMGLGDLALA